MNKKELTKIKIKAKESSSVIKEFATEMSSSDTENIVKEIAILNVKIDTVHSMCQDIILILSDLFLSQSSHFMDLKQQLSNKTLNTEQQLDKMQEDINHLANPFYQVVLEDDDEECIGESSEN